MTEIDWSHRESLRQWALLAARGHEGAQAVASYHGLVPPASVNPAPISPPAPAPAKAVTPRAPRAVVPAVPQPSPMLDGVAGKVARLTNLLTPPVPPDLF